MSLLIKGNIFIYIYWIIRKIYFQHSDLCLWSFSPYRLSRVVPALKGRGVAEVIANAK